MRSSRVLECRNFVSLSKQSGADLILLELGTCERSDFDNVCSDLYMCDRSVMRVTESCGFRTTDVVFERNPQGVVPSLVSRSDSLTLRERPRTQRTCFRRRWQKFIFTICALLVSRFTISGEVSEEEHLETLRKACSASSSKLQSGSGSGMYRMYESTGEGEWELKFDSEITTHFVGRAYYIELVFDPEFRGLKCRRILKNDRSMRFAVFSPGQLTGAPAREIKPENHGDGLARPPFDDVRWDVSRLSLNVWNVDDLLRRVPEQRIKIVETTDGDLVGSYTWGTQGSSQSQFACPRKFGFNIASIRNTERGKDRPTYELRVEWKQTESGLWYVRSLQEDSHTNTAGTNRMRRAWKYTDFKPNVNVEPRVFTAEFLRRPMGAQ
jgi:hypothetical protein